MLCAMCMVLILYDSEIGAHVSSNLCYFICSRHLIRSYAVTDRIFFSPKGPIFLYSCGTCSERQSNINTKIMFLNLEDKTNKKWIIDITYQFLLAFIDSIFLFIYLKKYPLSGSKTKLFFQNLVKFRKCF